jgi:hypothetical protein
MLTRFNPFLSYLIDFEESECHERYICTSWEDLAKNMKHPDEILLQWELRTRELVEQLDKIPRKKA